MQCESFLVFLFVFRNEKSVDNFFSLLLGNEIGDSGASYIAKVLKVNNTLNCINFCCE